jgi:hypothetical protein
LANAFNGLETSLSVCLVVAALVLWQAERSSPAAWRRGFLGATFGLAVLARIDAGMAALLFALSAVADRNRRLTVVVGSVAVAVVAGWWGYELWHFRTVIPASGGAVREIAEVHRAIYLDTRRQIAWATGTLLGSPFWKSSSLRLFLFQSAAATVGALAVWAGALWAGTRSMIGGLRERREGLPVVVLFLWGVAIAVFYVLYVPAVWFFTRYLLPCVASLTVWVSIVLARGLSSASTMTRRFAQFSLTSQFAIALLSALPFFRSPGATVDRGLDGAKGYRRAAREVIAQLPPGAVVGSLQSGALGYFGRDRIRVVNLDGVVDAGSAAAFASGDLAELARRRGVAYIADWPFNMGIFERRAGDTIRSMARERIGTASPQGDDTMEIWAVHW